MLVEVDLSEQTFVAKSFPTDHSIVKYSKIDFDAAGLELVNAKVGEGDDETTITVEELLEKYSSRIQIGMVHFLPKFIKLVKTFSTTDHTITIFFDVFKNKNVEELHTQAIKFDSKTLHFMVQTSNISEFEALSDDTFFNRVNAIENPMEFDITADTIKNLQSISSLFPSIDTKKDVIKFYTKKENDKWTLYAYDNTNKTYDYLLGYLKSGDGQKASIEIYRFNFFLVSGDSGEYVTLAFSASDTNKMRIQSQDANSVTIVASKSE